MDTIEKANRQANLATRGLDFVRRMDDSHGIDGVKKETLRSKGEAGAKQAGSRLVAVEGCVFGARALEHIRGITWLPVSEMA